MLCTVRERGRVVSSWTVPVESILAKALSLTFRGKLPTLPFSRLEEALKEEFRTESVSIEELSCQGIKREELFEGYNDPIVVSFFIQPLGLKSFCVASRSDIEKLQLSLCKEQLPLQLEITKGVCKYIFLKAIRAFETLEITDGLVIELASGLLPEEDCLAKDLKFHTSFGDLRSRFLVPNSTLEGLKAHYEKRKSSIAEDESLSKIPCDLSMQCLCPILTKEEIDQLEAGDLIVLSKESVENPFLFVQSTPLFLVHVEGESLTLKDTIDETHFDKDSSLTLELGRLVVPLVELSTKEPGDSWPFQKRDETLLLYEGQVKKKGEIFTFDDHLFFRILES